MISIFLFNIFNIKYKIKISHVTTLNVSAALHLEFRTSTDDHLCQTRHIYIYIYIFYVLLFLEKKN